MPVTWQPLIGKAQSLTRYTVSAEAGDDAMQWTRAHGQMEAGFSFSDFTARAFLSTPQLPSTSSNAVGLIVSFADLRHGRKQSQPHLVADNDKSLFFHVT